MVSGVLKKWSTFILKGQAINVVPQEHQEPLTQWQSITSYKTESSKVYLFKIYYMSLLTYAAETWTWPMAESSGLRPAEIRFLWSTEETNKERTGEKEKLVQI
jgi:hypothetical protein